MFDFFCLELYYIATENRKGACMTDKTSFSQTVEEFIKLNNLMNQIQKRSVNISNDLKISMSMVRLIEVIGNYPETSITELANRLGVTKGAISQKKPTLKKMKFIRISKKESDNKTKLISLTKSGREIYDLHYSLHEYLCSSINELLESFSTDQILIIKQILEQVAFTIKEYQITLTERKN